MGVLKQIMVVAVAAVFAGCATMSAEKLRVAKGDRVELHVSCRLADGQLIYSTLPVKDSDKISPVFFPPDKEGPVKTVAGSGLSGPLYGKLKSFENEVITCLATQIPGMALGESRNVTLTSSEPPDLEDPDRYLSLNTKRRYPLKKEVVLSAMAKETGREPVAGDRGKVSGNLSYVVRSVDTARDKAEVEIEFNDGDILDMPFGPGVLSHDGEYYRIDIRAEMGRLIRTPPLLGKIIRIEDKRFVIDYGHPFGGETLTCDVEIVGIDKTPRPDEGHETDDQDIQKDKEGPENDTVTPSGENKS